jgi:hypothetical protein
MPAWRRGPARSGRACICRREPPDHPRRPAGAGADRGRTLRRPGRGHAERLRRQGRHVRPRRHRHRPDRARRRATARALDAARAAGLPVVYLVMQFRPDLSDAGAPDSPNRIKHAPLGLGAEVPRRTARRARAGRGHLEHRDRAPPRPAPGRPRGPQAPLQRLLRDRARLDPARPRRGRAGRDGLHDERVRGVDGPRRDVPRLPLRGAGGLHRGADRGGPAAEQPRGVAARHPAALRLGVDSGRLAEALAA